MYFVHDIIIEKKHVTVYINHKPLEQLLATNPVPPPRIQRWFMRLQAYKYTVGIENAAGILSQSPSQQTLQENPGEQYIHHIISQVILVSINLSNIITELTKDEEMNETIKSLEINQWNNSSSS